VFYAFGKLGRRSKSSKSSSYDNDFFHGNKNMLLY
jgi:hypothetical protein